MTGLAKDNEKVQRREGVEIGVLVKANAIIFAGSYVCVDATGYLIPGDDAANLKLMGVAQEAVDNTGGSNGGLTCTVRRRGLWRAEIAAVTQADVGKFVYLDSDYQVALSADSTHKAYAGVIASVISATEVWVDIEPAIQRTEVVAHIADTDGAHNASAIDIADAGGFTATETVEAALQEIYPSAPVLLADPGDAEAIPVTRSGVCALTVGAGAETRTIAAPNAEGRIILVTVKATGGGAVTLTIAGNSNYLGDSNLVLSAAGQSVLLIGTIVATTRVWRVVNMATDLTFIPVAIADPGDAGAIPVTRNGVCAITTAAAETRTIAAPNAAGREITLVLDVDGGDCVITSAVAINVTGNNTITLDNAGEVITLKGAQVGGALVWRVVANDGAVVATV